MIPTPENMQRYAYTALNALGFKVQVQLERIEAEEGWDGISFDVMTVHKSSDGKYVLSLAIGSNGDRYTPPDCDVSDLGTYLSPWPAIVDGVLGIARTRIENWAETEFLIEDMVL
jgi:hypothetical protein